MNLTDEMLQEAAPEAARRWLDTLPNREDCGHDFSLTFQAAMEPLLRRRRRRRRMRTLAMLAAVIAALAALSLSTVHADRKDDYRVYAALDDGFASYVIRPKEDLPGQTPHRMALGWIPEDFSIDPQGTYDGSIRFVTRYASNTDKDRTFVLAQDFTDNHGGTLLGDFQMEDVKVNGEHAVLFSEIDSDDLTLLWAYGPNAYTLTTNALGKEDMLRIANNIKW